jgi:hypothetical protein
MLHFSKLNRARHVCVQRGKRSSGGHLATALFMPVTTELTVPADRRTKPLWIEAGDGMDFCEKASA